MTESPLGRAPDPAAEPARRAEPEQSAEQEQLDQPIPPDDPERAEHADQAEHPDQPAAPEPAPRPTAMAARSTLRRAPRFARFVGVGIVIGALLAALAAILGPPGTTLGRGAIFLLVFLALGSLGALLGSLLAVVADRRSVGRR